MEDVTALLERGRDAYRARDWITARDALSRARASLPLSAEDLYLLSDCCWWMGDLATALPVQQEAYRLHVAAGQPRAASVVALNVAYTLMLRGDEAQGSGWLSLAARHLKDEPEGFEHGYLVYVDFEAAFDTGDYETALARALETHRIGLEHHDPNLRALGVLGQGRVLVQQGPRRRGDGAP